MYTTMLKVRMEKSGIKVAGDQLAGGWAPAGVKAIR
jgi:hypothetical protein